VIDAVPSGVVPDTTGIRLQTAAGTPSFDSEGQVQGRLEVKVGDDWVTIASINDSFGGSGTVGGSRNSEGGEAESTVACRQLGNELGYTLVSASKVGRDDTDDGSGMAYEVTCAGTESTLDSCTSFESMSSYYHDYDVGVSCTFLAPGSECEECVAGKYSDTTGTAACINCAAGTGSTVGSVSCMNCDTGSVSPGGTACTECSSGSYANTAVGATECMDCVAGSYSTVVGSVSAADCQQVRVEGGQSKHKGAR
jgi:hypothetical protein